MHDVRRVFYAMDAEGNGVLLKRRDQVFKDPAEIFGAVADKQIFLLPSLFQVT